MSSSQTQSAFDWTSSFALQCRIDSDVEQSCAVRVSEAFLLLTETDANVTTRLPSKLYIAEGLVVVFID
ncbi:hypothetical protein SAMN06265222_101956 [Neorhodopirellula lusitana]|uniref:Uncharacterized protein n=1 Tax=Neorhodopirellula lusitana TaxID=445327 RepID=A0ABY1PR73_9BACT|nr:hypothetical protein SAMN06265222_101956 [Neorhodopirellula lusitana]